MDLSRGLGDVYKRQGKHFGEIISPKLSHASN
jgi:hypothetical protein